MSDSPTSGDQFFPYRLDGRWKVLFALLRVGESDGVTVKDDGSVVVTYGRRRVATTRANIAGAEVTGGHRWYTAVGLRLSAADDGLTFGTNHEAGLCIEFNDRIPKVIGFRDHSSLWVSVAEPERLAAALARKD